MKGKRRWDTKSCFSPPLLGKGWQVSDLEGRRAEWGQANGECSPSLGHPLWSSLLPPTSCQGEEGFLCQGILACCSSLPSPPNHSRKFRSWYGSWRIPFPRPAFLAGVCVCVAQSCSTHCDPMEGSPLSMNSPGKNTGVGGHSLLQGIFPTQESNLGLPHCRQILYHRSHQGSPLSSLVAHHMSSGYGNAPIQGGKFSGAKKPVTPASAVLSIHSTLGSQPNNPPLLPIQ